MASKASMSGRPALSFCFTWMGYQRSFRPSFLGRGMLPRLLGGESRGKDGRSIHLICFDARPHLNPLPRGEDFSNDASGDAVAHVSHLHLVRDAAEGDDGPVSNSNGGLVLAVADTQYTFNETMTF